LNIAIAGSSSTVPVYIYGINKPVAWKGKTFSMGGGTYWVGEIHIQYDGTPPSGTHTRTYCMQYDAILHTGQEYQYEPSSVGDTPTWRSISYILSWYDPPKDDLTAAKIQGAIWKILSGSDPSGYGDALASEASGKDVIRCTDDLVWLPYDDVVEPGEKVTLTAKITTGRPNVLIMFTTTAGVLSKTEGITNGAGEVSVQLTVPSTPGKVIEVKAYTRSVWPELYLYHDSTQNLIGLGDKVGLSTTTELFVIAELFVIPEVPLGTLSAVIVCLFALIIKNKNLLLPA